MRTELTANQLHQAQDKAIAALAKARQYRHHRDCYCRQFERTACSAADALWTRALDRELQRIADHYRRNTRP